MYGLAQFDGQAFLHYKKLFVYYDVKKLYRPHSCALRAYRRWLRGAKGKGMKTMRLDKFLKVSRIIKRRTVANEACDAGRVTVNGNVARASYNVKVGDIIEIALGSREVKIRVKEINEHANKDAAPLMYENAQ